MAKELKNVNVELISFVDKGANMRKVICKTAGARNDVIKEYARIAKIDEEKRLVYGVVYAPDDVDAHDDFMTAPEIEKAAHNFLAKSNTTKAVDAQHNLEPVDGVTIVESAIIKGGHTILEGEPDGTWFIVTKVENEEIWKGLKDGTYTGYSLYGFAERIEEAEKSKKAKGKKFQNLMERMEKWFNEEEEPEEIVKDFNEQVQQMDFERLANAFWSVVYDIFNDETITDKKAAILESVDQMRAKIEGINTAKAEITKAGKTISAANMKKLQDAMSSIAGIIEAASSTEEKRKKFKQSDNKDKGNNTMEDIKKAEHERIVAEKDAAIKAEQDKAAEIQVKLDAANAELEKSKGSKQADEPNADPAAKKVAKSLPFLR